VTTHVNINGGLFEAEVNDGDGEHVVVTVANLPAGQIPMLGQDPFPVIVHGRTGQGRLRTVRFRSGGTITTIDVELS
jgi:hypothetical protein